MKKRDAQRRQDAETLQDVRKRLEFSVSRLNDVDTQQAAIEELREFMVRLFPDWFGVLIKAIGDAGPNLKPAGRRESIRLYSHLAEIHGEAVLPYLHQILQQLKVRLQDPDLYTRDGCAECAGKLAAAFLHDDQEQASNVFASLLKPFFPAVTEPSPKSHQLSAATCILAVCENAPSNVVLAHLPRLSQSLLQMLASTTQAKGKIYEVLQNVIGASGAEFEPYGDSLLNHMDSATKDPDWLVRKAALDCLQELLSHREIATPSVREKAQVCISDCLLQQ
jgi:hypothetical protein